MDSKSDKHKEEHVIINPQRQQRGPIQQTAHEPPGSAEHLGFPEGAQHCVRNNQTSVIYTRFYKQRLWEFITMVYQHSGVFQR